MRYSTQQELYQGVTQRITGAESRLRSAIAGLSPVQLAWNRQKVDGASLRCSSTCASRTMRSSLCGNV